MQEWWRQATGFIIFLEAIPCTINSLLRCAKSTTKCKCRRGKKLLKWSFTFSFFGSLLQHPARFSARFDLLRIKRKGWKEVWLNQIASRDLTKITCSVGLCLWLCRLLSCWHLFRPTKKMETMWNATDEEFFPLFSKGSTGTSAASIAEIIQDDKKKTTLMPFRKSQNIHHMLHLGSREIPSTGRRGVV